MAELRLNDVDLDYICPECNGGFVPNLLWKRWWHGHDDSPPEGHALLEEPEELACLRCAGVGYVPTKAGRTLIQFLRRYHDFTKSL
jgi:hypothetical protein